MCSRFITETKKILWITYTQSYGIKMIQGDMNRLHSLKTTPVSLQFYRNDPNYSGWQLEQLLPTWIMHVKML